MNLLFLPLKFEFIDILTLRGNISIKTIFQTKQNDPFHVFLISLSMLENLFCFGFIVSGNNDSEECLLTLQMLWKCPILEDIDLDSLEQCILSHDYPYFVALLLPFMRQEKRSNLIKVSPFKHIYYIHYLPYFHLRKIFSMLVIL